MNAHANARATPYARALMVEHRARGAAVAPARCRRTSRFPVEPGPHLHSAVLARLAPSASVASLAQTMSGSTADWPTQVP